MALAKVDQDAARDEKAPLIKCKFWSKNLTRGSEGVIFISTESPQPPLPEDQIGARSEAKFGPKFGPK